MSKAPLEDAPAARDRHWLILSHGFNMDGRAASLTITDKIPYLLEAGIRLTVVSAVTGERDRRFRHLQLFPWGPSGLRFDLRHLLAAHIGRGFLYRVIVLLITILLSPFILVERVLFGLQGQAAWALPATARSLLLILADRPTLIYSTGGAYSAHLAGYWLKRLTGIKWIAEIHDPMVVTVKNRNERFAARLEGRICRHADLAWWFTERALERARGRHPELGRRGMVIVPGSAPPRPSVGYRRQPGMSIGYFGSLSESRSLLPFVTAVGKLVDRDPDIRRSLRVNVYGDGIDAAARGEIARLGLDDVFIAFGRLEPSPEDPRPSRVQAFDLMRRADCLLLLHGCTEACSEYIPLKVYEYLWAERPVIALTYRNEELDRMLAARNCYVAAADRPDEILAAVERACADWQADSLPLDGGGLGWG